jgi:histidyl-tRNA synthetase
VESELQIAQALRQQGLSVELYPEPAKFKRQFKYANDRGVRWVVVQGEEERSSGMVALKDMAEGTQIQMKVGEVASKVRS